MAELINGVIARVADKWTMMILDVLAEHGETRFLQLQQQVGGISQKMLTQTLRDMERDGLVIRTVHAEVPPRVEYRLTDLGLSLRTDSQGHRRLQRQLIRLSGVRPRRRAVTHLACLAAHCQEPLRGRSLNAPCSGQHYRPML
ncbi:helix-turn-helix domain-containing protein [Pseudomonas sp. PA15(2017)]|uniref:winged helix-turn-helix transcriptional regulator n=1 Tax=Pseudomonas sp. PA15(2017) TaxID=1932111 RepID=UPI002114884C|nr:helix-turn-helix domain-containing protein [Pseudomonas sp. PA15(2017)]